MYWRLERYLIREGVWLFFGFLALACSILLIERMVRLAEIVSDADNPGIDAVRLITRLLPHYIELALPCALVLTTIITVNRLSRNGEITAILFSGVSLYRVARPFFWISVALAVISIVSSGYLKPLTRYSFRALVFEIGQDNISSAFQDQRFIQVDDWTAWTKGAVSDDNTLGETFILETREDGRESFMIGRSGVLTQTPQGGWEILLNDAMIGELPVRTESGGVTHASVRQINWQMPLSESDFRSRGVDERELTLVELVSRSYTETEYEVDPVVATADLHDRLVRAVILIPLTLMGVVLGLNLQRRPRTGGLVIGILLLLSVQKLLEFGLFKAQLGLIPIWAGSWPVFLAVTALALGLLHYANGGAFFRRDRPLTLDRAMAPTESP